MCDPRVHGSLLFRCMVAGLYWHFHNFSWLCKVFLQTSLHFASQFCNLKAISTFGGDFPAISKLGGDFTVEKYFRSPFRNSKVISQLISQLRNKCTGLRNGTRVPKKGFTASKYPAKWSFGCKIGSFYALGFRSCFTAAK